MTGFNQDAREAIWVRDFGSCVRCGIYTRQCHHRRPRRMGGSSLPWIDDPANGLLLCGFGNASGCHGFYERNRLLAIGFGVIIEGPLAAPWDVGCYYARDYSWRRLLSGGDWTFCEGRDLEPLPA